MSKNTWTPNYNTHFEIEEFDTIESLTQHNYSRNIDYASGNKTYVTTCETSDKVEEMDQDEDCEVFYITPRHKCHICKEIFDVVDLLSDHLVEKHMGEDNFIDQCLICGLLFHTPLSLSLHLSQKHAGINPYRCRFCARRFPCRKDLNLHIEYLHIDLITPYECDICGRSFEILHDIHDHKATSHKKIYNCPYCVKCYDNNNDLKHHLQIHTHPENYADKLPLNYEKILNEQNKKCFVCGVENTNPRIMNTFKNFEDHILSHSNRKNFQCLICPKMFFDFTKYYDHYQDHLLTKVNTSNHKQIYFNSSNVKKLHCGFSTRPPSPEISNDTDDLFSNDADSSKKSTVRTCILCNKAFKMNATNAYEQHMNKHSSSINLRNVAPLGSVKWINTDKIKPYPYYCKPCKQYFALGTSLLLHNKKIHKTMRPHKCTICTKDFAQYSELFKHGDVHPGIKKYTCDICDYKFIEKHNYIKHKQNHKSLTSCNYCGINLNRHKEKHENHMAKHIGENLIECEFCEAPYTNEHDLNLHIRTHHNINPEQLKCRLCGKQCTSAADVLDHNRTDHPGEEPYKCEICGKTFKLLHCLGNHKIVHLKSKYKCQFCGKPFTFANNLKMHLRYHTGERPYFCQNCPKTFSCQADLYEHKKTHKSDAQFTCETCGKSFEKQKSFNRHRLIHSNMKPYKCTICSKQFAQKYAFEIHSNLHSKIHKFSCSVCKKMFISPFDMQRHEKKVHYVFKTKDELKKIIKDALKSVVVGSSNGNHNESSDDDIESDEFDENDDEETLEDAEDDGAIDSEIERTIQDME